MGMVILAILITAYIMIGYGLFLSVIIEDYTQNVWIKKLTKKINGKMKL